MPMALFSGITGQDGRHQTKYLMNKGYMVAGIVNGQRHSREEIFALLFPEVKLIQGDLTDFLRLLQIIHDVQPDKIHNLGEINFVGLI
jgi:GDPmannose 4,6-dehydratase